MANKLWIFCATTLTTKKTGIQLPIPSKCRAISTLVRAPFSTPTVERFHNCWLRTPLAGTTQCTDVVAINNMLRYGVVTTESCYDNFAHELTSMEWALKQLFPISTGL